MMSRIRVRRVHGAVLGGLAAAMLLTGCGGGHHAARTGSVSVGGRTMHFRLAAASAGSVSAEVPSQPIGTTPTTIDGLTLQLYVARRVSSAAVLVVFGLQVSQSAESGGLEENVAQALALGPRNGPTQAIETPSGVSLLDPTGLKEYETFMADPSNDSTCLCSILSGADFDTVGTVYLAALVAAPPQSVTSVSFVTGLGTIPNVTLTG